MMMMMMIPHGLTFVPCQYSSLLSMNAFEMHSLPLSLYLQSKLWTFGNISPIMQYLLFKSSSWFSS